MLSVGCGESLASATLPLSLVAVGGTNSKLKVTA